MENNISAYGNRLLSGNQVKGTIEYIKDDVVVIKVGDKLEEHLICNMFVPLTDYLELKTYIETIKLMVSESYEKFK